DEEELKNWRKHRYFDHVDELTPLQFHLLAIHLFVPRNSLQMSPAINSNVIVKLKIAPDAKPGRREFRLVRGNGQVSNPLPFYVDTIPGTREPYLPVPPNKKPKYEFRLPTVINGQIMPGETDRWFFTAKKGEKLVFRTFARCMIPFMGDCVPGYFQCILELKDSKNNRIAFADDRGFDPDPLLCCTIPADGEYVLEVRDALYRGRADFVYRIRAWKGDPPKFKISKPNLNLPLMKTGELAKARTVKCPVLLQGCIAAPAQTDKFVIEAEKGEKIVGEVFARQLGSQLDSRLTVLGPDGKSVAFNDDYKRVLAGPLLQHTDSWLCFTAPESGKYTFLLTDTSSLGSPDHAYFLRIDHPKPSFKVYVTASSKAVFINGATPLKLLVEPQDGFNKDIRLRIKSPNGYYIIGSNIIPAGCKETTITLGCTDKKRMLTKAWLIAEYDEMCPHCKSRTAIPGSVFYGDEDTQAFAYTHLVLSGDWFLSKNGTPNGVYLLSLINPKQKRVVFPAGKTGVLRLRRRKLPPKTAFAFSLLNPPKGVTLDKTIVKELKKGEADITLVFKAAKDVQVRRFNQLIRGTFSYHTKPNKEGKVFQRKSEFVLPAMLFEITGD
ncbi:MAG: hypothetical protein IKO93_16450, partial [Lentisphaeria bacterium]|nr:hypothetical protein [Lentisphaeria bacterium]